MKTKVFVLLFKFPLFQILSTNAYQYNNLHFIIFRLSYHQRVTDIVPSNFAKLLPPKPVPFYKYEKDGAGTDNILFF